MQSKILSAGKLDIQILRNLLKNYSRPDEKVLLGPGIGEDAAAIDMGDRVLIVTTDPITFATDEIGYYSVVINANDVATTGADPRYYSVTILLPETEGTERLVHSIFRQIHQACEGLNISLIGGHTEITYGLDRPILVGQMIGEVQKEKMIATAGAKSGDLILMSKGICIEGTSVIAREKEEELLSRGLSKDLVERAQGFLFDPGISILQEARLAFETAQVHSMHDITEGGLVNGLHEISMAAGVEIEVELESIPIYEESQIICDTFDLNPLGVIGSGSLLITAAPAEAEKILDKASTDGVAMTRIGCVKTVGTPSVTMVTSKGCEKAPYFDRDEVVKIF